MTGKDLFIELSTVVKMFGFRPVEDNWHVIGIEDDKRVVNFFVSVERDYGGAMATNRIKGELFFRASICSMGGNPTADELKKSGERIIQAANLVQRLNGMNLKFTEVIE